MTMGKTYVVFGTGRMGRAVAWHLVNDPETVTVRLADTNHAALKELASELEGFHHKISLHHITEMSDVELSNVLSDSDVCIATCGYQSYVKLTEACIKAHCGMVDLGGNRDVVDEQKSFDEAAKAAGVSIVPDCGLAPGMIGILGMLAFQQVEHQGAENISVNMRVGGLPMNPGTRDENPLQYLLTWSPDGLINEYEIPADELRNGTLLKSPALTGCEDVVIKTPWRDKTEFEAFVTGGGSSNLPFLLKDRALNVNYKTLRYRGHCEIMRGVQRLGFFANDFKVNGGVGLREVLTAALEHNLTSKDGDDLVIARAGARGALGKKPMIALYEIFCAKDVKRNFSAMAQTTGYSAAIVAQLIADKTVKLTGVVDGELAVPGEEFVTRLQKTGIKVQIKFQ